MLTYKNLIHKLLPETDLSKVLPEDKFVEILPQLVASRGRARVVWTPEVVTNLFVLRYSLLGQKGLSQAELAAHFGTTRERILQVEQRAFKDIRTPRGLSKISTTHSTNL